MERINFELYDIENEKKLISKEYRKLLRILKNRLNPSSRKSLRHAFEMAVEAHSKTRRKSGELYIFQEQHIIYFLHYGSQSCVHQI